MTRIRDGIYGLYHDCQINKYSCSENPQDIAWEKKYVEITYGAPPQPEV